MKRFAALAALLLSGCGVYDYAPNVHKQDATPVQYTADLDTCRDAAQHVRNRYPSFLFPNLKSFDDPEYQSVRSPDGVHRWIDNCMRDRGWQ